MFGKKNYTLVALAALGTTGHEVRALSLKAGNQWHLAMVPDTIPGNAYQDFEPDSGEIIHLYPTIKNYWGLSNGVKVSIEIGGNEFQNEYWNSIITITEAETTTGSVSAYATYQMLSDPLEFTIADDVAHNTQIEFILKAWDEDYPNQIHAIDFNLKIKSSVKLQGLIENDTILYADREYLIDNTVILKHANLIIKPGVTIRFGNNEVLGTSGNIQLYSEPVTDPTTGITYTKESKILALGTRDSLITIMPDSYGGGGGFNGYSLGGSGYGGSPGDGYNDASGYESNPYQQYTPSGLDVLSVDPTSIPVMFSQQQYNYTWDGDEYIVTPNGSIQRRIQGSLCNYCEFKEGVYVTNMSLMNSILTHSYAGAGQGPNNFAVKNNFGTIPSYGVFRPGYYNNISNIHYGNGGSTTGAQWQNNWRDNNVFNLSKVLQYYIDEVGYDSGLWDPVGFNAPYYQGFTEFDDVWIGAGTVEKLEELNIDAFNGGSGVWEYTNPRLTPYEEAHAVVWKVLVNGINSFDNYITMYNNPISVGTHEFKIYFNCAMNTSVRPLISYGVTQPFTQNFIDEEGEWSSDGKIYSVNHEIKIGNGTSDGLNRIRVTQAIDAVDGWEIPKDNLRFNMLVQSAGSLSTGFFAEGGLGKIDLEWVAPSSDDLDDVLGYNMYRYEVDTDGVESDPVKLNDALIIEDTDESTTGVYYTDFNVVEGQTYFYKYNILRTSFETTDYSS